MKLLTLCVLSVALCASGWAANRRAYAMNVSAAGVQTLNFDVQEGDFVLRGDPNVQQVEMRVSIDRYWLFKLGEEGILKKLIKISGEGTPDLTIATQIDPSWRNWGRAEYPIDFEIVVPASVKLKLHDTSGKISIYGINAAVEITDTSGTLKVQEVRGPLGVRKESGDILIDDVTGPTTIASHSGQMKLREVGVLTIEGSNGNIDLIGADTARIISRGGNVSVADVNREVDVQNDSGEIVLARVGGEAKVADTSGGIRATRTGALTIRDTSGDVTVDTAAAVHVVAKESGQVKVKNVSGAVEVPPGITLKRE